MPKVAFPIESSSTVPQVFDPNVPFETLSWLSESSETVTYASLDTITLWPTGSSTSSEGGYPLPSESESSNVIIVTTTAYAEPSQKPPSSEPERTTTTTTTSIKTTFVEHHPPSSSCSCSSASDSEESSVTLTTEETSEPAQPTETSSATVGAAPCNGFIMLMLGVVYVFVDVR